MKTKKPAAKPAFRRGDIVTGGNLGTQWDGKPVLGIVLSLKGDTTTVHPITGELQIATALLKKAI